jgi:hypothetical protein
MNKSIVFLQFVLILVGSSVTEAFTGAGSGTEADPYIIRDVNQLQEVALDTDASYELGKDVDASATQNWNGGEGFDPIDGFGGHFDGKEHVIKDLFVDRRVDYSGSVGLFGNINGTGEVKNLGLIDVNIRGPFPNSIGSLAGSSSGLITNCHATGQVYGNCNVGGLVGSVGNYGTLVNCYCNMTLVRADVYVSQGKAGGLVGFLSSLGTVQKSYAKGYVTAWYAGGLVGRNYGTIENCYSKAHVCGSESFGGLIGFGGTVTKSFSAGPVNCIDGCWGGWGGGFMGWIYQGTATITDCFWDINTSGYTTSECGGTGKTTAEMKQQATFTNWDFVNVWGIIENETYPFLRETPPSNKPPSVKVEFIPWGSVGQNIAIRIHAQDSTNYVERISLFYREKGTPPYKEISSNIGVSDAYVELVIPSSDITNSGIEFYVVAFDDLGFSAEWKSDPDPWFIPCGTVYKTGFSFGRDNYSFDNNTSVIESGLQDLVSAKIADIFSFLPIAQSNLLVSFIWGRYAGSGGYCWGMSETSAAYYKMPILKPLDKAIYEYTLEEAISAIRRWHEGLLTPFLYSQFTTGLKGSYNHKDDYYRIINGMHNDWPVVIILWRETLSGAHAVVARGVVDAGSQKYIFLYNPNEKDTEYEYIEFWVDTADLNYYYMVPNADMPWERCYAYDPTMSIASADFRELGIRLLKELLESQIRGAVDQFVLACPADVLITDDMGRRIGHIDDANVVNEIPDAKVVADDEIEIYEVPTGPSYSFKVTGLAVGKATIDLSVVDQNEQAVRRLGFMCIPITDTSILSGTFDATNPVLLYSDDNGDGNYENIINPDYDELVGPNDVPINLSPMANAGLDQTVFAGTDCLAQVSLNGSDSNDPDGDELTYKWTWTIGSQTYEANGVNPTIELPLGVHTIQLVVNDGTVDSAPDEVVITVLDITPPEFSLSVSPSILWPPNHKMVKIAPTWTVSDNCDESPTILLVNITMNEGDETNAYEPMYDDTTGDGHTIKDIQVSSDGTIYLRAERSGNGSGRVYVITYKAIDDSGNVTIRSATVTVPHNQP